MSGLNDFITVVGQGMTSYVQKLVTMCNENMYLKEEHSKWRLSFVNLLVAIVYKYIHRIPKVLLSILCKMQRKLILIRFFVRT